MECASPCTHHSHHKHLDSYLNRFKLGNNFRLLSCEGELAEPEIYIWTLLEKWLPNTPANAFTTGSVNLLLHNL